MKIIEKTMDEVFNGSIFNNVNTVSFLKGYDTYEKDGNIVVELPVVGFTKKEIDITVEEDCIKVLADSGQRDGYGFRSDIINKRIQLPRNSDTENIQAKLKDGLLAITIPIKTKKKSIKIS